MRIRQDERKGTPLAVVVYIYEHRFIGRCWCDVSTKRSFPRELRKGTSNEMGAWQAKSIRFPSRQTP
jgi:hypothetical protein